MMSETTLGFLSTLRYRADAKRQICWLPLAGIFWEDEMPDIRYLMKMPEDDREQIFQLFTIRMRLWKGESLADTERQLWDTMYSQVPNWAFFRRKQVSEDDQYAQGQAERAAADALEAMICEADEVNITERNGIQEFSATFDLTKTQTCTQKKRWWWQRLFARRQVSENQGCCRNQDLW